jgi:hypothetical protein
VNLKENIKKVLKEEINKFELVKNLIYTMFDNVINLEYNTERNEIMVYYDTQEELESSEICDTINKFTGLNVVPWYDYKKRTELKKDPDFYLDTERYEEELNENYSPAGKEITPNKIVVHKSNPKFRDIISNEGLKVRAGECYKIYAGYGEKCIPAIFATNSTNKRASFDSTYDDDVWEIDTEMIPDVKWYKDRHYESSKKHIVTFENIPADAITLKHEGTGKDWGIMESVDKSEDKKLKLVTKMIHEFFDEVSFIKIKKYENKPLIRVYFNDDEYAGESYFAEQIQDKIYKYTGIKLIPYWHTIQYNTDADFRLDAIKLKYDNEGNVINESEDITNDIEKNLKAIRLLLKQVNWEGLCDIWVEYDDLDKEYAIKSKYIKKDFNNDIINKELDFLSNVIKSMGLKVYIYGPWFVDSCEDDVEFINESTFFRRRVDMGLIDKEFFENLNYVTSIFLKRYNEGKRFDIFQFKTRVLNYLMDNYHGELSNGGLNDFPYDEVYEYLSNHFHDKIKDRYDTFFGNNINESEEKKPKYLNIIKDIVEPYKKEECVCDINVSYDDEDDMYSIYLKFGVEDLNDKFLSNGAHHYVSKLKNDVKDTIKGYLPINELYVGSYGTKRCDRKPMNESKNNSNKNVIEGVLNSMVLPEYEHVICDIKVKDPSERFNTFGETPFKSPSVHVTFIGGYGTKLWPVTQGVKINYDNVMDYIWNIIYDYTGIAVDIYSSTKKDCEKKTIHIKESTKKELRILKENTKRLDPFIDEILSVHKMSNELIDFIKKFIEESNCKRIDFSKFKMGVMGVALETGVLINRTALNQSLPFLLFLIFHEITHQYQFKKYGDKVMYDCYIGNVSEIEGAEFMKHTEEVADDLASRKIRELQKLGLIGEYTPMQMYKNLPIEQIKMMVNHFRNEMRIKNIQSPKKVSEYFYNIVKSEI